MKVPSSTEILYNLFVGEACRDKQNKEGIWAAINDVNGPLNKIRNE
jgi:hypothetical protein